MRVDFPSFSSDLGPRCLVSAITLTLSFLWSCLYFSPIQTLQYMSSFCSAPCSDPRLWNVSLILVLHISALTETQLLQTCCAFFFLMLNCFLLFLQNNSIILSFPFLVISSSHGLPPVSEYHFLPIS